MGNSKRPWSQEVSVHISDLPCEAFQSLRLMLFHLLLSLSQGPASPLLHLSWLVSPLVLSLQPTNISRLPHSKTVYKQGQISLPDPWPFSFLFSTKFHKRGAQLPQIHVFRSLLIRSVASNFNVLLNLLAQRSPLTS